MNHREYMIKVISSDVVESDCRCRQIQQGFIDKCIDDYDKSKYHNLEHMITDTILNIKKYTPLEREITAKGYAHKLNIAVSTARRWLAKTRYVSCNSKNKPFIYSL